jgi:hypothetical protein
MGRWEDGKMRNGENLKIGRREDEKSCQVVLFKILNY